MRRVEAQGEQRSGWLELIEAANGNPVIPKGIHPTIAHLVDFVRERRVGLNRLFELWYRGHANKEWELAPRALRVDFLEGARKHIGNPSLSDQLANVGLMFERVLNQRFQRQAAQLLIRSDQFDSVYFQAQHFGLPTRLLDWSTNPLIALYFACAEDTGEDGEVLVFSPYSHCYYQFTEVLPGARQSTTTTRLAQTPVKSSHEVFACQLPTLFYDNTDLKLAIPAFGPDEKLRELWRNYGRPLPGPGEHLDGVVPVQPSLEFSRIANQKGCFTFHPVDSKPLSALGVFPVAAEDKRAILDDLRVLGITPSLIYPELSSVAEGIRAELLD